MVDVFAYRWVRISTLVIYWIGIFYFFKLFSDGHPAEGAKHILFVLLLTGITFYHYPRLVKKENEDIQEFGFRERAWESLKVTVCVYILFAILGLFWEANEAGLAYDTKL